MFDTLNKDDIDRLDKHREWLKGHFDDANAYSDVSAKLRLVQTILDNRWVNKDETWKLQSLGVAFGDALVQIVEELAWVAVDDEYGRDPGLRWLETSLSCFPLTAISKRIENGETVDVYEMVKGFHSMLRKAVSEEKD